MAIPAPAASQMRFSSPPHGRSLSFDKRRSFIHNSTIMNPASTSTHTLRLVNAFSQESQQSAGHGHAKGRFETSALPVQSDSLLRGQKAVAILHNGSLYKLQATKLGKLILTK
jgi:hemin uptake protein HemP